MERRFHLTAIFEQVENGWTQARIREIPGVITAAPTREQAEEMLLDALREYLLSTGDEAEVDGSTGEQVEVVLVMSG